MRLRRTLLSILLVSAALAGCLGDDDTTHDNDSQPAPIDESGRVVEPPVPEVITHFGDDVSFMLPGTGQGIWIHEGIVYHTNGGDLHIVDARNPENMTLLGELTDVGARDVDILEWEGHLYALLAGSGRGMHVVDVTDPEHPEMVTTVSLPSAGVHNLATVPGTPYIYSSGASDQVRRVDVLDISVPLSPVVHSFPIPATWNGVPVESDGCHDITVRVDLGRAYCAGGGGTYTGRGGESFIWDISKDPLNPEWLGMMDDPRIKYHHQALANADGTLLVLDDEHIIADNCVAVDTPLPGTLDPQIPLGAAWIWDISDERNPVLLSIVQNPQTMDEGEAPDPNVNCGSHFGDIIPGHDMFVMGWYSGGTLLVDFTDPEHPEILDIREEPDSTWDARYWGGYIFHASSDLVATPLL